MRKLSLALVGAGIVAAGIVFATPALADNGPHIANSGNLQSDSCAGCHRAHTAKSQGLLKTNSTQLCTSCHSAGLGALTDVMAGQYYPDFVNGNQMLGLRGGGFTTAALNTTAATKSPTKLIPALTTAPTATTSAHSIDGTAQTAWGGGTTGLGTQVSLTCTSCHDPHGNGNYRILRPLATGGTGANVNIADATTKTYFTTNYWSVKDNSSTSFINNISSWCAQCHTRYQSNSAETNTGDPTYTFRHETTQTGDGEPNCIQCHVAHGSNATMTGESAKVPNPGGTVSGSSRLLRLNNRGTCVMCHNK